MKTTIGTEVAHVTRDSDTTFKVEKSTCKGGRHIVAASRTACYTCGVEAANDAQTVWVNTACGIEHSQK